jgi:hypothetical protein
MRSACGNSDHISIQTNDIDRQGLGLGCAIAELTMIIVAPTLDGRACGKCAGVGGSGCKHGDVATQGRNIDWARLVDECAITELAVVVAPPTFDA